MRSHLLFCALFVFIQHGIKYALAAPTIDNAIPSGSDENVKLFRETYSQRVKSYMNLTADPCDDFYEFACGNFANAIKEIETDRKRSALLDIIYTLHDLIEKSLTKKRDADELYSEELQKAKHYLHTCMNTKIFPIEPIKEYLDVLKEIGGFPAIDPSWNASAFDWFNMTSHLSRHGIDGLVKEKIYFEYPFPPYYELPKFGFDFDIYLENMANKKAEGYVYNEKVMRDLLKVYGVTDAKADKVIDDVFEFMREALEAEEKKSAAGSCDLLSIIDELYDFEKWPTYFKIAWGGADVSQSEISECPCTWYYSKLDQIIAKRPEAAANYMALKFLFGLHPRAKSANFHRQHCLTYVKKSFPYVLTHFYMKEHYDRSAEGDINEIISELRVSLRILMETADWLDEPTRAEALGKVKTLVARVGQIADPIIDNYIKELKNLTLTDNFAANNLEIAKFNTYLRHYGYLHPEIPEKSAPLDMLDVVQVNAFYYVLDNSINVMGGILHEPVYHKNLPKSVKYGSLGYILGHELTHGFDKIGSTFDSNLTIRNWWSKKSGKAFDERVNCFVEHYTEYKIPGIEQKPNGTTSQDENVADNGGLREALDAYRRVFKTSIKNKVPDFEKHETLPGLDLTPEQIFFVSFAQLYCSKYDARHYWVELSDDHPMDRYRVLGSLQNFEEFPLVYNCPLGSPMHPKEKCRLW